MHSALDTHILIACSQIAVPDCSTGLPADKAPIAQVNAFLWPLCVEPVWFNATKHRINPAAMRNVQRRLASWKFTRKRRKKAKNMSESLRLKSNIAKRELFETTSTNPFAELSGAARSIKSQSNIKLSGGTLRSQITRRALPRPPIGALFRDDVKPEGSLSESRIVAFLFASCLSASVPSTYDSIITNLLFVDRIFFREQEKPSSSKKSSEKQKLSFSEKFKQAFATWTEIFAANEFAPQCSFILKVLSASELPALDKKTKSSDPYCSVSSLNQGKPILLKKTQYIDRNLVHAALCVLRAVVCACTRD
jgi:hypothetical protein